MMAPGTGINALSQCAGIGKGTGQALSPPLVFRTIPLLYTNNPANNPAMTFLFWFSFQQTICTIFQSVNLSLSPVSKTTYYPERIMKIFSFITKTTPCWCMRGELPSNCGAFFRKIISFWCKSFNIVHHNVTGLVQLNSVSYDMRVFFCTGY